MYPPINMLARLAALVVDTVTRGNPPRGRGAGAGGSADTRWTRQSVKTSADGERGDTDTVSVGDMGAAELTLVVVPGNPGNALFYTTFITRLHALAAAATGKSVAVVAFSHPGHSAAAPRPSSSVEEHVRHAAGVVATLQRQNTRSDFVLVGHSIGGRIILEMFEAAGRAAGWDEARVAQAVLLFPTVAYIGYSPNCRAEYYMLRCHRAVTTVLQALEPALQPQWLKPLAHAYFARRFAEEEVEAVDGASPHAADALVEVVGTPGVLGSVMRSALDGMQSVLAAPTLTPAQQRKIVFYMGGQCEKWIVRSDLPHLERQYKESAMYHCRKELPHGFVLSHSDLVASMAWQWIAHSICPQRGAH